MKILSSICILFFLTAFACCKKFNDLQNPKSVTLKVKDCSKLYSGNDKISICFDSLLTDSRCPQGALCIWEGYAAARFSFSLNSQTSTFDLAVSHDLNSIYTTDTIISGYKIEFTDLTPYPDIFNPTPPSQKKAVIKIVKQ